MGNIQKKLTGKSEGGKRSERGAPRRGRTPGVGSGKGSRPRAPAAAAEGGTNRPPGGGRDAGDPAAAAATAPAAPASPLGPAGLKNQGNELFKSGQFPEAALKYSAAIAQLEPAGRRAAPAPPRTGCRSRDLPGRRPVTGARVRACLPSCGTAGLGGTALGGQHRGMRRVCAGRARLQQSVWGFPWGAGRCGHAPLPGPHYGRPAGLQCPWGRQSSRAGEL